MGPARPKLLIIDDDRRNVFALSLILKSRGYKVISAPDAATGLDALNNDPEISIVLLDMMMPEMDGYEMLAEVRRSRSLSAKTYIAVTAQAMQGDKQKCIAAGASDYLSKPVDVDLLIEKLKKYD